MVLRERGGGRWLETTACQDDPGWRKVVWADFAGAMLMIALLGGLLGMATSCT
ncbi:hypothetical protein [Phenylobacterium sp. J367]|uniref:hypothetical protein n=1 Tax=Phenylobacterium sp. J367 TaxID=2898435 RepID=UPI002151B11C|nr:hypothetical protein [Phenylobacterium sp. J367]MCR5878532.1 hypothetical protein [Phenylobacterium sp. J367]